MAGKQVTELDALPSFTDTSLLPTHNGAGLKKGTLAQLVNYLGMKFSNPNLLINPNFKINIRGKNTYTSGYSVDRWKVYNVTLNASTLVLSNSYSTYSEGGTFLQSLENKPTGTFTITLNVASVTGTVKFGWKDGDTYKTGATITKGVNTFTFTASSLTWVGVDIANGASVQLSYMKLEEGSVATDYIEPNGSEEYVKCLWYDRIITGLRYGYFSSSNKIYLGIPECASMRTSTPTPADINLTGWIYIENSMITVNKSDITAVTVDGYKELVLTPTSALAQTLASKSSNNIAYVINANAQVRLDAEIY